MADQPPLNDVLLGDGVKQMQEISREEILRQIFGDIGELADDFTCAVESTVLLHGRMYITNRFICFYSNLFGLEKKIRIPYSHIRSITKENTAMVIPNAIAISTDKKDYTFRSFWDREDCFRILTAFLNKFRGLTTETPAPSKLRQRANTSSVPREAEDADAPASAGLDEAVIHSRHQSLPAPRRRALPPTPAAAPASAPASAHASVPAPLAPVVPNGSGSPAGSAPGTDPMDGEFESDTALVADKATAGADQATLFAAEVAKCTQKISVVSGQVLNISMKDFADLVIEENAPYGYKWYHESVKDNSIVLSKWAEMPGGLGLGREMKFFKPVNLPGLASTRGVKLQKYRKFDEVGLILCSSTRLEDVPCADAFSVEDTLVIRKVDANTCTIDITFCVQFVKSTMLKYFIESSTNPEVAKWQEVYFKHLKKITDAKKAGTLTYPDGSGSGAAAAGAATPPPAPAEPAPAPALTVAEPPSTPTGKGRTGGGMVDGFLAMLSFKEESFGDQLKFGICLLFVLYLVVNYVRWGMLSRKVESLEAQLKAIEALAQKLLRQQAQAQNGGNTLAGVAGSAIGAAVKGKI